MSAKALTAVWTSIVEGRAKNLRSRQTNLRTLFEHYVNHGEAIIQAIQTDDSVRRSEAQCVYGNLLLDLRSHYEALSLPHELGREYSVSVGKSLQSRMVAVPAAYIIPDQVHLLYSALIAVHAAIEAGSCIVIEVRTPVALNNPDRPDTEQLQLENTLQASRECLRKAITEALDNRAYTIITSRASSEFLAKCVVVDQTRQWSPLAGVPCLKALTSNVDEMVIGIVDRTADVDLAAKELVSNRLFFASRSRYAVDVVLVNEFVLDQFTQAATETLNAITSASNQEPKSRLVSKQDAASAQGLLGSGFRMIVENKIARIALITSRDSQIPRIKGSANTIILRSFTSLENVLDLLTLEESNYSALYVFSAFHEAKYLSQYIPNRATFVNHVPAELLAGPIVPEGYETRLDVRYTREMFEYPSPQIIANEKSHKTSSLIKLCKAEKAPRVLAASLVPLKPTGQPPAGAWDFFGVGIILGATFYLLPIVAGSVALTGYASYWTTRGLLRE